MKNRWFVASYLLLALLWLTGAVHAEDKPPAIRVAVPGVGIGNRPVVGGSAWAIVHLRGLLEDEFKADGIPVTWSFLRGAGPAVNELYANRLVDFANYGDLPSIIGRASGLDTRILASGGKFNLAIGVPVDSPIRTIQDLKGAKFAIFKGTCLQLATARILEAHGLTEKDVRAINMDGATARAALATKDVDAVISGSDLFSLRDQGVARIIYSTKGDPRLTCNGTLTASGDFVRRYPSITKRVVKVYVQASRWLAERQQDASEAFQLWTRSGQRFSDFKEDWQGEQIKEKASPLLDAYLFSRYEGSIADAKRYGLIRKTFDFGPWVDASFLQQVLQEQGLSGYWAQQPAVAQAAAGSIASK